MVQRIVRTEAGSEYFGVPIGSKIEVDDDVDLNDEEALQEYARAVQKSDPLVPENVATQVSLVRLQSLLRQIDAAEKLGDQSAVKKLQGIFAAESNMYASKERDLGELLKGMRESKESAESTIKDVAKV